MPTVEVNEWYLPTAEEFSYDNYTDTNPFVCNFGPSPCQIILKDNIVYGGTCWCAPKFKTQCRERKEVLCSLFYSNYQAFLEKRREYMSAFEERKVKEHLEKAIKDKEDLEETIKRDRHRLDPATFPDGVPIEESATVASVEMVTVDNTVKVTESAHEYDLDFVEMMTTPDICNRKFTYHGFTTETLVEVIMRSNLKQQKISLVSSDTKLSDHSAEGVSTRVGGVSAGTKKQLSKMLKKLVEAGKIIFHLGNNQVGLHCTVRKKDLTGCVVLNLKSLDMIEEHRTLFKAKDIDDIATVADADLNEIYSFRIALFNSQHDIFFDNIEMLRDIAYRSGVKESQPFAALPFLPPIDNSTLASYVSNLKNPDMKEPATKKARVDNKDNEANGNEEDNNRGSSE